ncbi:MAG: hypothetical protein IKD73_06970 [Selenomonadaceae bacterium]|nr:hypothetical protein [Selenomonadaceae bacterium]
MRKFLSLALMMLITCSTCAAANVHAIGRGNTERMAIRDAMRAAIEQKFGAVVNSKSRVANHMLIADENSVDSTGFISSWEIISSRVVNGIYVVEISAELDEKKFSAVNKKALVDFNADSPRVAVVALDSAGKHYADIENEIIAALKRQGFTRTIDLAQVSRAVQLRMTATDDDELYQTLANDFHADYLVIANVHDDFSVASRLIALNTGEIIFAGTSTSGGGFLSTGDALKFAGRRAGYEISTAALKSAAQVERHLTLLITKNTFEQLGGTLTAVRERIKNISGVNDVFARKLTNSLELDVDFDGTAADFAQMLEVFAIKILEVSSDYVKI